MNYFSEFTGLFFGFSGIILTLINLFIIYRLRTKDVSNSLYSIQIEKYIELIHHLNDFNITITVLYSNNKPFDKNVYKNYCELRRVFDEYLIILPDSLVRKFVQYFSIVTMCYPFFAFGRTSKFEKLEQFNLSPEPSFKDSSQLNTSYMNIIKEMRSTLSIDTLGIKSLDILSTQKKKKK
ncbi:MAG: hypothetical protein K8R41_08740 [Bacteroidales bacterium]|nr:hypothetical protein [Bacteroidales bacterium]